VQTAQNRIYEALKHGAKWMKAGTSRFGGYLIMILYDTNVILNMILTLCPT